MKTCAKCNVEKDSENFHKRTASKDGLATWCKPCQKEYELQRKLAPKLVPSDKRTCSCCNIEFDKSNFYINNHSRDGLMSKCKFCSDKWALENPVKARSYVDKYHTNNRDKIAAQKAKYREENINALRAARREDYYLNKSKYLARRAAYQKAHPDKCNAVQAKRRAQKLNATVKWADYKAIKAVYSEAQRLSKETGVAHHVDHIVPLINERVCGLHVEFNLRVIPATDNLSKGNYHWPNM